ncbi:hypothetical protein MWH25_01035 [Natroniella acetigena]|nr:hypothetical protein [Natroniella acetigena]
MLDRIDIHLEVPRLQVDELTTYESGESSAEIRARVKKARKIQLKRFDKENIMYNARMNNPLIKKYCTINEQGQELLKQAISRLDLSARAYDRILKLARTIADLAGEEVINSDHIAEAIQYRSLDRSYI